MKNIFALAIIHLLIFSCKGPSPEPTAEQIRLPDGKLEIKFTDVRLETNATMVLSNNDVLAVSFNIKKSLDGNRPVKMAVYITENPEMKGVLLWDNILLKDVDEQTKSLEISLPAVGTNIFRIFYVDILDNKGKSSRKILNLTPTGIDQITAWNNVNLGIQGGNFNSRFSSATGDVYAICDLDSNINFVDITYAVIGSPTLKPTFSSNPQRPALGLPSTASDKICNNVNTSGGTTTFFAPINVPIEFGTVDDLFLKGLSIPNINQDLAIEAGKIYMFQNSRTTKNGKSVVRNGVIKINSISNPITATGQTITSGVVNFDVKVQR